MAGILIKRGKFGHRYMQKILELCLHKPRDYQKIGEKPGTNPFLVSSKGIWPCQHFSFRLLITRAVREYISVI